MQGTAVMLGALRKPCAVRPASRKGGVANANDGCSQLMEGRWMCVAKVAARRARGTLAGDRVCRRDCEQSEGELQSNVSAKRRGVAATSGGVCDGKTCDGVCSLNAQQT